MTENLNMALELMGQGMAGIVAVLGIIALLVVACSGWIGKASKGIHFTPITANRPPRPPGRWG